MDLYNAETKQKEEINDPEALQTALENKTHGFPKGEEIPAINPYGEKVWIKSDEVHQKVAQGYKIPTPHELQVENFVEKNKGILGAFGVAGAQAVDEFFGGLPELIYNKKGTPLDVAKKEALKKEHEFANLVGGLGGGAFGIFKGPLAPLFSLAGKAGAKTTEAATKLIAEKLGVEAGGVVSQKALNKAAANIVGKTLGMGVEGGIIAVPHAITESLLGDPHLAAEHLMGGVGIGMLFGGGIGLSSEMVGLGKKVAKEAADFFEKNEITKNSVVRQVSQVFTGVPEKDIKYYVDNFEDLQRNPPLGRQDLVNKIYETVEPYEREVLDLKDRIKTNRTTQSIADEFAHSQEQIMARQRILDDQGDEILASLSKDFDFESVKNFVKFAKEKSVPVEFGKTAKRAARELDDLIKDLDKLERPASLTQAEKEYYRMFAPHQKARIPAPMLRNMWKAVRKDINWNVLSTEYNDVTNAALKDISHSMRQLVKDPAFNEVMEKSAKLADLHKRLGKAGLGDRNKAASIFDRILKKQAEPDLALLREYDQVNGTNFLGELHKYNNLRDELVKAEARYKPISIFSKKRNIEAGIKDQGYKNPSVTYRDAFENLQRETKINFPKMVKDTSVLEAFTKASIAGSRKTVGFGSVGAGLGTAIGGAPGGFIGGAVGALTGMIADIYGAHMLKRGIDTFPSVSGLLFTEKALKRNANRFDTIPEIIKRMSSNKPKHVRASTFAIDVLWRLLEKSDVNGNPHKNKKMSSSSKKLSEISERVSALLSDPNLLNRTLSEITYGLTKGGAPNIANDFIMIAQKVLQYIEQNIPKPPKPLSPFQKKIEWKPPDFALYAFAQKLQVLEDPFVVLEALEDGSLTKNHIDALQAIFPDIFLEIQKKAMQVAMSGEEITMDYSKRIKLSLLLDVPIDSSLRPQNINYLQSSFLPGNDQVENEETKNRMAFRPDIDQNFSLSELTQSQQLQSVGA